MKSPAQAMVLASFTADSLALGVHWIYDTEHIDRQFGRVTNLLPPAEGSYHPTKKLGALTHYGDQSLHLLRHLVKHCGQFSLSEYARDWQSLFTNYSGYLDRATKVTLHNLQQGLPPDACGSPSTDLGGAARIAPLIYCYRENLDELLKAVHAYTALTHCGSGSVDGALFLARSCYDILHGTSPREAFIKALDDGVNDIDLDLRLRRCLELTAGSIRQVVKDFGQMCSINAALPGAIYAVLHHEDNLEEALVETAMAGGDSAARGMVTGMILGARLGMDGIPVRWLDALIDCHEIQSAIENIGTVTK